MEVRLSDFNKDWRNMYLEECRMIKSILEDEVIRFEHFGSTSIEGMKAKPVIDMMVIVNNIEKIDLFDDEFLSRGYDLAGEWGIKGRRLIRKGGINRTHHIHIYEQSNPEIDRHLILRDYLREHREAAIEYSKYKEKLAEEYNETAGYSNAKKSYVKNLEQQAIRWYKEK